MEHFPRDWPFVRGIHRSPVNSPRKGQRRRALMFSLICVWINDWVNNRKAGDLRRYRAHYDVIIMKMHGVPFDHQDPNRSLISPVSGLWMQLPTLHRRHNERDGVSNHRRLECLLNRVFWCRSMITPKLRVTGLCEGNLPVTGDFPEQRASNEENVFTWWRHHENTLQIWFLIFFYKATHNGILLNTLPYTDAVYNNIQLNVMLFYHCI